MKHADLFTQFLNDVVNLNPTRVADLETSIDAIKDAVRASAWPPKIISWMPQGSWAHKTIIKPVDSGEFDADLLVFVQPVKDWSATQYVESLYAALRQSGTYKDKVRRYSHCVTVEYANEKKVDIAPCVVNRGGYEQLEVCNRSTDQFERSEPRKYTDWLVEKNGYSGSNSFRKVTRLVKYLRDIKGRFTCSSVLLTTLLGYRISSADQGKDEFSDTPTALRTIFSRMDDWLQMNLTKPSVVNPFLPSENFAEAWTDDQYLNFREKIHTYREWIDDAFAELDRSESIGKWRRVFGSDFASSVVLEEGKSVSQSALASLKASVSGAFLFAGDLVEAVRRFGVAAIPERFYRLPYMERPAWKRARQQLAVFVKADLHVSEEGTQIGKVDPDQILPAGRWLHFRAVSTTGVPFNSTDYLVEWRVTNTDEAAFKDNCLRGEFYKPKNDNTKWEQLKYRGVHLVEAFVILKRDQTLVGQSEAYRVIIE